MMNVLSLFDGMSCGQIALNRLGVKVNNYYASEVDKYAMEVTKHNFPNTKHIGDVREIDVDELPKIDLLIGGSPCQNFSFAGSRKGMTTKEGITITSLDSYIKLKDEGFEFDGQSYLFWEYIRIYRLLKDKNPNIKFLLENVVMSKEWEYVISNELCIEPIKINSALVSAQNRNRLYWTNIYSIDYGLFGDVKCGIPQPEDKGILLKDILEDEVDEKYFLSEKAIAGFEGLDINKKGRTLRVGGQQSQSDKHNYDLIKIDKKGKKKKNQNKASCFTAGANSGGNHSDMDLIIVAMRGRNPDNPSDRTTGSPTEQRLEPKTDGKTNCLTTVQKDNLIVSGTLRTHKDGEGFREVKSGKGVCVPARPREDGSGQNVVFNGSRIRRLTPIECERLQTVPDNYTNYVSDTQRYKMLGNGWTIDVIAHIFKYLNK